MHGAIQAWKYDDLGYDIRPASTPRESTKRVDV
jgi:hypothetical protein